MESDLSPAVGTDQKTPLVSVLIVNFNGAAWLGGCLDSLEAVEYPSTEVIVVDNASTDGSLPLLAQYPWVRVVRNEHNTGFAGGNNRGLAECRGEYVLLLNNDTVVSPGFLGPLVQRLRQHPRVGIVQAKLLLSRHGGVLDACGSFLTAFGFLYHVGYWKPDGPRYARGYPVFSGKGACLLFRKELVDRVGGFLFQEEFFCYYEETDFCHRAWLTGVETHFEPESVVEHLHGATGGEPNRAAFVLRHYLRNQTFALLGNLSWWGLARVLPLYGLFLVASAAVALVSLRWSLLSAYAHAIGFCFRQRRRIVERRRLVKRLRVMSDAALFARLMRTPGPMYFWRTFTGSLSRYEDRWLDTSLTQ